MSQPAARAVFSAAVLVLAAAAQAARPAKPLGPRFQKQPLAGGLNESCAIADVNRDGKPDVIAGDSWYEGPDWNKHPLRDLKQTGPGNEYMDTNGNHALDLNGDGWIDVVAASWFSDKISWYENPGKEGLAAGTKWQPHPLAEGHSECEGTLLQDLDGDGAPDLIVNHWNESKPVTAIRIKPGKGGAAPEFTSADIGDHGGHGVAVGDVNGDGRLDIVIGDGWYEAPAERWTSKWKFHKGPALGHTSVPFLVVDLNGDKRNDLIVGLAHDYGLFWMEQGPPKDGEPTWTRHDIDKSFSQVHCLVWADLEGDGRPELITGKRWRPHNDGDPGAAEPVCVFGFVWDPQAKTFAKFPISYNDGVGTGMQICVGDLNGDQRPDIAVAGKTGTYLLINRGTIAGKRATSHGLQPARPSIPR